MDDAIHGDRRSDRRYQIGLELTYEVRRPDGSVFRGTGWTRNMSGAGLLFDADIALEMGLPIQLWLEWPRKLQDLCPLELAAEGLIVRCDENRIAVRMEHYELRTRGARSFQQASEPTRRLVALG